MAKKASVHKEPQVFDLGQEGEMHFERLRAGLALGEGFELFLCGFHAPTSFAEVKRRLTVSPPANSIFHDVPIDSPDDLLNLAEKLIALGGEARGRKTVFAGILGWEDELRAAWMKSLRRLNERRNKIMHECPNAIILAGPIWMPWLAHDTAPDLWSVRTALFTFPNPISVLDSPASLEISSWKS